MFKAYINTKRPLKLGTLSTNDTLTRRVEQTSIPFVSQKNKQKNQNKLNFFHSRKRKCPEKQKTRNERSIWLTLRGRSGKGQGYWDVGCACSTIRMNRHDGGAGWPDEPAAPSSSSTNPYHTFTNTWQSKPASLAITIQVDCSLLPHNNNFTFIFRVAKTGEKNNRFRNGGMTRPSGRAIAARMAQLGVSYDTFQPGGDKKRSGRSYLQLRLHVGT